MRTDQAGDAGQALHSNGSSPRRGGCGSAAFVDVAQVLGLLRLAPGARVLDLGAGHGDWVPALARRVGPAGRVLALERDPLALARLRRLGASWPQLEVHVHDLATAKAPNIEPAHAALMALVLHHLAAADRAPALTAVRDCLRPGARLALVEFKPVAPPPGPARAVRLLPGELRSLAAASGWRWMAMHSVAAHVCCYCLERP